MRLPKGTDTLEHIIWQPRYRDKTVLVAKRVVVEHNLVRFTEAPSLGTDTYYLSGKTIRKYKTERMKTSRGGSILVHPVPLDELVPFEGYDGA